jgi:hypothetical protein
MVALPSAESILPSPLIDPLRCRTARSGFRNVYQCGTNEYGVPVWKGRVKLGQRLRHLRGSASTLPHVAALAVARWYAATFGPRWPELVRTNQRRENPWRVWYSPARGGWLARVWIRGAPTELVPLTVGLPTRVRANADPIVFRTRDAARAAVWPWVAQLYPESWRDVVYRTDAAPRVRPHKWRAG